MMSLQSYVGFIPISKFGSETQDRINKMGFIPVGNTPEQFAAVYKNEFPVWERVVKMSGAKLD